MEVQENQKQVFPSLSTGLGNRIRDSHIPTAPSAILQIERRTQKQTPYHILLRLILR